MSMQTAENCLDSLVDRQVLNEVLAAYGSLLPGVTLGVLDAAAAVVAIHPAGERDAVTEVGRAASRRTLPLVVEGTMLGRLAVWSDEARPAEEVLRALQTTLDRLLACGRLRRLLAAETLERYREINLLYKIGESINASLDLAEIPTLVLREAGQVVEADTGLVVLTDGATGAISEQVSFGEAARCAVLEQVLAAALEAKTDVLLQTEILTELPTAETEGQLSGVIMAPMSLRGHVLGLALLGRAPDEAVFTAGDRKLLTALASQTAVAVENARLFASVKEQRDAIAKMNVYMENIFASLASGVITLDPDDRITFLNAAAEEILGIQAGAATGQFYGAVFPSLEPDLAPLVESVRQGGDVRVGYEAQPRLPERGWVNLQIHISPLQGMDEEMAGVTIVVDDLTEQKQLEAEVQQMRSTFERYVSPRVVEQLLSDPSRVQLGGTRQEVTILFADIRKFTAFSERRQAEMLFEVLNRHLTLVAEAILDEEGTLDKFMGDAVMAIFNAPLPQERHVLRAVRAAWKMKSALARLHTELPADSRLSFGIGISTGPAVVGNVGSPMLQNYTAIGNTVNLAARLQSHAGPGQILLGGEAYERIQDQIHVQPLGQTYFKGRREPTCVFELLEIIV